MRRRDRSAERDQLRDELDQLKLMLGQQYFALRDIDDVTSPVDCAHRVFSQFGEDGVLDCVFRRASGEVPRTFIEIGVESYRESNTRFLCESGDWTGLIVDAGDDHVAFADRRMLRKHRRLVAIQSFLTASNVNDVITAAGFGGEIGLLSLDVDGVDYWLARALTSISPAVVMVEHNPYFGSTLSVTVPYEDSFVRRQKHPSGIYFGASIRAWADFWVPRGYELVAVTAEGLNLVFLRRDLCPEGWALRVEDAYRRPSFSPYLHEDVPAAMLDPRHALEPIRGLTLQDLDSDEVRSVGDLLAVGLGN